MNWTKQPTPLFNRPAGRRKTFSPLPTCCFNLLLNETIGHWFGWSRTCAGLEVGSISAPRKAVVRAGERRDCAGTPGEKPGTRGMRQPRSGGVGGVAGLRPGEQAGFDGGGAGQSFGAGNRRFVSEKPAAHLGAESEGRAV